MASCRFLLRPAKATFRRKKTSSSPAAKKPPKADHSSNCNDRKHEVGTYRRAPVVGASERLVFADGSNCPQCQPHAEQHDRNKPSPLQPCRAHDISLAGAVSCHNARTAATGHLSLSGLPLPKAGVRRTQTLSPSVRIHAMPRTLEACLWSTLPPARPR